MPFDNEAKEMVRNLVRHIERLTMENVAYFSVIECVRDSGLRDEFRSAFRIAMANPQAVEDIHAKFSPVYERISLAMDEATALEILRQLPLPKQ